MRSLLRWPWKRALIWVLDNPLVDALMASRILVQCLSRCRTEMSWEERVEHVWKNWTLKNAGRREEYASLKLAPYVRSTN
jgi:hypothetical protein